jgi:hypothetical protein
MKWVISANNLDCLLLLHLGNIGRNLIRFSERNLLHITIITRKENLISLQRVFLKNPKQIILNLKNIFQKENVSIAKDQDILLISALNLPKGLKKELNALNIEESEKENIFRILQNNDFSDFSSENDFLTSDDSDYHSAIEFFEDDVKIGCFDSCCNKTKICNVLTKNEEQENLLITLISKIENAELKE